MKVKRGAIIGSIIGILGISSLIGSAIGWAFAAISVGVLTGLTIFGLRKLNDER